MKKNLYLTVLAALALAGCSNEIEEQTIANSSRRVSLQVSGNINLLKTRAYDASWNNNDAIGIYLVGADNSVAAGVENYRYITANGDGTFVPATEDEVAYLPENGEAVTAVAYYPQGTVTSGMLSLNLSEQSEQGVIDLMAAKAMGVSKENPAVSFQFAHQLTKLYVEIDGNVNTMGITATIGNQYTDVEYGVLDGTLTGKGKKGSISMKSWGTFVEAIVLPNDETTNPAEDRALTFQLNGKEYKAKIAADTKFEAGKKYKYKATFNEEGAVTIQGAGITNWDVVEDDDEVTVKPDIVIEHLYLASGFTDWGTPHVMEKDANGKIFTWTGLVTGYNQEMKFTIQQRSFSGDWQLMPNATGDVNKDVDLNAEMDIHLVQYSDGQSGDKLDNKWLLSKGTYSVTVNVETMKLKVEKLDVIYLTGDFNSYRYEAMYKNADGNYEVTVSLPAGNFKFFTEPDYSNEKDYFATENDAAFTPGSEMTIVLRPVGEMDYKWKVEENQAGTYKLVLNPTDSTLTATKVD